jgi:hypothetical protein
MGPDSGDVHQVGLVRRAAGGASSCQTGSELRVMHTGVEPREGWTVGLNHEAHDSSCALLKDGELRISVEQERLSRRKRAARQSPAERLRTFMRADIERAGYRISPGPPRRPTRG